MSIRDDENDTNLFADFVTNLKIIEVKTWERRMSAIPQIRNYARLLGGTRSLRIHLFNVD